MNDYERIAEERINAEQQQKLDRQHAANIEADTEKKYLSDFARYFMSVAEDSLHRHMVEHPLVGNAKPEIIPNEYAEFPSETWLRIKATDQYSVSYGPWKVGPKQKLADVTKYGFDSSAADLPFQVRGPLLSSTPAFATLDEAMREAHYLDKKYKTGLLNKFDR